MNITQQFKSLNLNGMADCYAELSKRKDNETIESALKQLIHAEETDRALRSIGYQMRSARFPIHRSLLDFDFKQARVDETLISELSAMSFTDSAQNVVLVGGTGCMNHLSYSLASEPSAIWRLMESSTAFLKAGSSLRSMQAMGSTLRTSPTIL